MAMRFVGKTALVTGGSRGIGRAVVIKLLQEGAKAVYVFGRSQESLDKLKSEHPSVNTIQLDVTDWDKTKKAVEAIEAVDLLVNNAALFQPPSKFIDVDKESLDTAIDTNFKSVFNISQVVARRLISAGRPGAIVNISSTGAIKPFPDYSSYCITKAMVEMLTKVMALELGPQKIRVNTVIPTTVSTDMTKELLKNKEILDSLLKQHPLGQIAAPEDVANAVLFLLSDEAAMVTGSGIQVDGGSLVG